MVNSVMTIGRHEYEHIELYSLKPQCDSGESFSVGKKFRLVVKIVFAKVEQIDEIMFKVTEGTGLFGYNTVRSIHNENTYGFNWRDGIESVSIKEKMFYNLISLKESGHILDYSLYE